MIEITYTGIDAHGNGRGGRAQTKTIAGFVESKHLIGWRQLAVRVEGPGGSHTVVGGIETDSKGARTWWAEQTG